MVGAELRATGPNIFEDTELARAVTIQDLAMKDADELLKRKITSVLDVSQISSSQVPKILDFYNKPWFTRTWPVQEVVLSRMKTVLCGLDELEWAYVGRFATFFIHKFSREKFDAERVRGLYATN